MMLRIIFDIKQWVNKKQMANCLVTAILTCFTEECGPRRTTEIYVKKKDVHDYMENIKRNEQKLKITDTVSTGSLSFVVIVYCF